MGINIQKIIVVLLMVLLYYYIFSLPTTGSEKVLHKILPEETVFIYEQFDKVALVTEKEAGVLGTFLEMLKTTPMSPMGIDTAKIENYLKFIGYYLNKLRGLKCKQTFAVFYDERSPTYLKVTIPMFVMGMPGGPGGMGGVNAPSISIPIGIISTYTCEEGNQWEKFKKYNYTIQKKSVKLLKELFGKINLPIKLQTRKHSNRYSEIFFTISDPTQIVKFNLQLYTYLSGNTVISSTSKLYIKNFIRGVEGTLYSNDIFRKEKELLNTNKWTTFWWFNFQKLYTGIKNIVFQFIPPVMLADFFRFEAIIGLNKIGTFSGVQDANKIWKERINLTVESDFINTVLGKSGYDRNFVCADIDTKKTLGFIALSLTKEGVLALIDKIKILIEAYVKDKGGKSEFERFINSFTKYMQNEIFSTNACITAYSVQENNEEVYRIAVLYKTKDFSQQICEEVFADINKEDCKPTKTYDVNSADKLTVWFDNSAARRVIFSKAKNLFLVISPIKKTLPQNISDILYKEVMEKTTKNEKNPFNTAVGINLNIKNIFEILKKGLEAHKQRGVIQYPERVLEYIEKQLGENLYIKVSADKYSIEIENNAGGASIYGGMLGIGIGAAIAVPTILRGK